MEYLYYVVIACFLVLVLFAGCFSLYLAFHAVVQALGYFLPPDDDRKPPTKPT